MNQSKLVFYTVILYLSLGMIAVPALADILMNNTTFRNDLQGERIAVTIRFPSLISGLRGDLYVAFQINQALYFLANGGQQLSTTIAPFSSNTNYSGDIPILNIPAMLVPTGSYTVYQVTTLVGADPINPNNWIGGNSGLSAVSFSVAPQSNTTAGQQLYQDNCAACHGSNPGDWPASSSAGRIRQAINTNRGGMGFLSTLSDADLQAIAAYASQF